MAAWIDKLRSGLTRGLPTLNPRWQGCPHPDEEILLADDSWIKAKDIKVGDKVKTLTAEGFKEGEYEITHAEIIDNQPRCEIFFKGSKSIISSYSHPYAVEDKGFVDAKDLEVGDHVSDLIVTDTKPLDWGPVVSLSVDKAETYMLKGGSEDKPVAVLSHNKRLHPPTRPPVAHVMPWHQQPSRITQPWLPISPAPARRPLLPEENREYFLHDPQPMPPQPMPPPPIQEYLPTDPLAPRQPINVDPQEYRPTGTVVPRDPQQPAPINQFGGTVVRRGPEFQDRPLDIGFGWARPFLPVAPMPMPSLTPEEIMQQRIDQVSQFEQEPKMEAQNEYLYGYAGGGIADLLRYYRR
jgi:hypothetical protein